MPSMFDQAKNFMLTAANVMAGAASSGKITASSDVVEKRLAACHACPHLSRNRCTVCGCYLNIKTGLKAADCPLKKW